MSPLDHARRLRPIFVVSFPRSGTHLTIDFLRRNFAACKVRKTPWGHLEDLYTDIDRLRPGHGFGLGIDEALHHLGQCPRPVVKTHCFPDFRRCLPGDEPMGEEAGDFARALAENATLIYVVRDIRDVVCSYHLWARGGVRTSPDDLRTFLHGEGEEGGSIVQGWAEHVGGWLGSGGEVHAIKYEDLIADPTTACQGIAGFIGEDALALHDRLPPKLRSRWHRRWVRLTQADPGSTAVLGARKGHRPLRWQEVFEKADYAFLQEKAGPTMEDLGYLPIDPKGDNHAPG